MKNFSKKSSFIVAGLSLASLAVWAADLQSVLDTLKSDPYSINTLTPAQNQDVFAKYCKGNSLTADIPEPKYSNPLVLAAGKRLSLTKTTSDGLLREMAKKSMENTIKSSAKRAQKMAQSANPEIKAAALELQKEILETDPTLTFSTKAQALHAKLTSLYFTVLKPLSKSLSETVPNQLQGLNYEELKQIAKALEQGLKTDLKPVNFKDLASLTDAILVQLNADLKPVSKTELLSLVKIFEKYSTSTDEDVKYLMESITSLKNYLAQSDTNAQDMTNYISEVMYTLQNVIEASLIDATPEEKVALEGIQKQHLNSQGSFISEETVKLKKMLSEMQPETNQDHFKKIKNAAESLLYTIQPQENSLSPALSAKYNAYKSEVSKFNGNDVLVRMANIVSTFASNNNEEATNLLENIGFRLEQVEAALSDSTKALVKQVQAELENRNSEEVIKSVVDLKKQFDLTQTNTLTAELNNAIQNAQSYLSNENLDLPAATKKFAQDFVTLSGEASLLEILKENLKAKFSPKESEHFYFYGGVTKLYKLSSNSVPDGTPDGIEPEAHIFLTQLCGEYRDRATMIEAKLNWANNILILPKAQNPAFTIDPTKNVWAQVPASAYQPYLDISSRVWGAKRKAMPRYIKIGTQEKVDNPVPGFTVCETKYIFSEYIGKEKDFDNFEAYSQGLDAYKTKCSIADQSDYYDFRGDSNYKHYSPEANGMIWTATSLARACKTPFAVKPNQKGYTDQDCQNYFSKPFSYRYNSARAGLGAWLLRDEKHAEAFTDEEGMVAIYPHRKPELAPFSFSFDHTSNEDLFDLDETWLSLNKPWNTSDMGFNALMGLGTNQPKAQLAYERLRDAVDRHTNWYKSGYNDKNGGSKDQAYSPFVASSYEMSESDNFTQCGTTVQCDDDGLKRWMFVFRIKADNWYTPARILKNEKINFDKMWFDETSFGDDGLANSEKAWDRLGTPMEEELESILYLVHVNGDGGFDDGGDEQ